MFTFILLSAYLLPQEPAPLCPPSLKKKRERERAWYLVVFQIVIVRKISLDFGARQTVMEIITVSFNSSGISGKYTTIK